MDTIKRPLWALALASSLSLIGHVTAASAAEIVVGSITELTGGNATIGSQNSKGIQLA